MEDYWTVFQFYIVAIDRSWKPLSSRALVTVSITYTNIERSLGFSLPVRYITIEENSIILTEADRVLTSLDVINTNANTRVVCEILYVNEISYNSLNQYFGK